MNQNLYKINAESITKRFHRATLFKKLSFTLKSGESYSITGPNGSGKSTLLKIIAGLQSPTKGTVEYNLNEKSILMEEVHQHLGFISPLINPYDELTGYENIHFAVKAEKKESEINTLLEKFNLLKHKDKSLRHYSSGMKQRLKFIVTIINNPPILFFDEPGTNLDRDGKDIIYSYIDSVRKDKLILIATNEKEEVELCREEINIGR